MNIWRGIPDVRHKLSKTITALCEVDLRAIRHNYKILNGRVARKGGELGAVVKANAYGLGATEITKTLLRAGCRDFFVAYVQEGLDLRKEALEKNELVERLGRSEAEKVRVYVLTGLPEGLEELYATNGLIPCLGSLDEVKRWNGYCQSIQRPLETYVHVDTGMART